MLFALGALAALGLFLSLYFWRMDASRASAPSLDAGVCRSVLDAPEARVLFGVPNYALGAAYHAAILLGVALAPTLLLDVPAVFAWVGVSAGAFAMSLYLAARLLRVLHITCRLCFLAHGVNAALHALFLLAAARALKPA